MRVKQIEGFPYMYETHCHSSEASACARNTAVEMAKAHKEAGYAGMILTNHNWGGNTSVSRELMWDDMLDVFFEPFYLAKEWGDANDFQVFEGYEAGYSGTEFLIYGITIEWMHAHPELKDATVEEQFDIIHSGGGIVVHAHPFREAFYISSIRLYPNHVDAIEALNASHCPIMGLPDNSVFNEKALKYAAKLGMVITGGSDSHCINLLGGGMAFSERLRDIHDLADAVRSRRVYRVTDGISVYDQYGGTV